MWQTRNNQEESKIGGVFSVVLQFFCRFEISSNEDKKGKNAPPCTLFSRPGSSGDEDGNQLVQIFGILSYPFPNNNKVNACTTSGRQRGDNEAINKTNRHFTLSRSPGRGGGGGGE